MLERVIECWKLNRRTGRRTGTGGRGRDGDGDGDRPCAAPTRVSTAAAPRAAAAAAPPPPGWRRPRAAAPRAGRAPPPPRGASPRACARAPTRGPPACPRARRGGWPPRSAAQRRHKAQGTRHKAQGTRHKAQGTPCARGTHTARSPPRNLSSAPNAGGSSKHQDTGEEPAAAGRAWCSGPGAWRGSSPPAAGCCAARPAPRLPSC